ncbi:MAG: hypothetical protein HYY93_08685 [Planctomycetes bacterium]|nr:hypothetical protein [Planctomycetota bacterium]
MAVAKVWIVALLFLSSGVVAFRAGQATLPSAPAVAVVRVPVVPAPGAARHGVQPVSIRKEDADVPACSLSPALDAATIPGQSPSASLPIISRGPARTHSADDPAAGGVQTADMPTDAFTITSSAVQSFEAGSATTLNWVASPDSVQLRSACQILETAIAIGGPTPNREKCLSAAALGECAFVAGSRSEFRQRTATLFGNAPGLIALYGPLLDGFERSLAEERWGYLASLDPEGNETTGSQPLPDRVSGLSHALSREMNDEHLAALFGVEDPAGKAREWVESALLDGLYDLNRYYFLDGNAGTISVSGTISPVIWSVGTVQEDQQGEVQSSGE